MKHLMTNIACAFSGGLGSSAPYFYVFMSVIIAVNMWFIFRIIRSKPSEK